MISTKMYKSRLKVWDVKKNTSREEALRAARDAAAAQTSRASATSISLQPRKIKKYLRRNGLHHFIQDEKTSDPAWTAMTVSRTPPDMHDVQMSLHFLWTMSGWASWCKESGTWVDTGLRLSSPRTTASSLWAFDTFYAGIREAIDLIEDDQTLAAGTVLHCALEFCDGLVMATHWTFFLRLLDLYDVLLHRGYRALRKFLAREILAKHGSPYLCETQDLSYIAICIRCLTPHYGIFTKKPRRRSASSILSVGLCHTITQKSNTCNGGLTPSFPPKIQGPAECNKC